MTASARLALPAVVFLLFTLLQLQSPFARGDDAAAGKHVVFLIGEREYNTRHTLPRFAREHLQPHGFKCTFVHADQDDLNHFPGLEALAEADLLFVSVRRRTLTAQQLDLIRTHFKAGKPMIGIRTASHAFSLRNNEPPAGHVQWIDFDRQVLGARYDGHYRNDEGTEVTTQLRAEQHPILTGVRQKNFLSGGTLYKSYDLGPRTTVLLRGLIKDAGQPIQMPVAWTNLYGKSRIFYTSLGHEKEFDDPTFTRILTNAAYWCLAMEVPGAGTAGSSSDPARSPASRNRYPADVAGNDEVQRMIRSFQGRGEVGDDSLPTSPEEAVKLFNVVDDLQIELIAAEPDVTQPLYMSWDHRGRMWVVQYLQYPFPAGLKVVKYDQYLRAVFDKVPPPPPRHFVGKDKITVFEDTDGDGTYDTSKDVITGLNIATAVVTGHGGIWVLNPPYLLFYRDADGDDVPEGDPEVHLSGFGLEDTHSVANSLRWGPDGWLYGANGSTTTATINSAATQNLHFKGQCIWRYHPDSKVFEIYAEGGGNTFSTEIDDKGRVFSGTNNGGTRGMYYAQGGYAKKNWGKHGPLTNPYSFGYYQHMRHEGYQERFSQTFAIYQGGALPERYNGTIISANALHNRVLASRLLADTSTYRTVDLPPLVLTRDRWFRPVDVKIGPDGAVYLADWYDSRLTHVDPRDNWHKTSGRIYRLRAKDARPIAPFDLSKLSNEQLIELFGHQNKWFRQTAIRLLGERKDLSIVPTLRRMALDRSEPQALEALWALNLLGGFDWQTAVALLVHDDPHVRRWTVRLLGDAGQVSDTLANQLVALAANEPDVQVRSQLASSAKRLPARQGLPIVSQLLARQEDTDDLHIPLLLWWAIEDKTASDPEAVLAMFSRQRLWRLPMVQSHVLHRLMQRYAMAGTPEDLEICARLLEIAPTDGDAERLMSGLLAAFQGRQITDLPESLDAALNEYKSKLGQSDLALGLRLGDEQAVAKALKIVADNNADLSLRLAYIEILGQIDQPEAVSTLLKLLSLRASYDVKRVALQALMNYDDPLIGRTIAQRYHSTLPAELGVRGTALRVLASRKSWAMELLAEIDDWRIKPQTVPLEVVQQMRLHDDQQINRLIEKHWGKIRGATPAEVQKNIQRIAALIRPPVKADQHLGKKLFAEHCGKCHILFGEGGQAGPDLTGYERTNLDFLLTAIVDPSVAIREEFTNFVIATTDGRTLTGLIDDQNTRTITLRGVDGQATLVNLADVDQLQALSTSLMPDGLLAKLNDQQVRDLFSYLMRRAPSTE